MRQVSRGKKIAFFALLIAAVYVLSEVCAFVVYFWTTGEIFSFSDFQAARMFISHPTAMPPTPTGNIPLASLNDEVLHPYLGYVKHPGKVAGYSEYGFPDTQPLLAAKSDNVFVVGIFGGSFAEQVSKLTQATLISELKQLPALSGKEIVVHTVAIGGYKQPQQLIALTYFLALGAHFDLVINIDGFNEVALAPAENAKLVFPFYPRGWPARVNNFLDAEKLMMAGKIRYLDQRQKWWAAQFATTPLRYNITANLVWRAYHIALVNDQRQTSQALERYAAAAQQSGKFDYLAAGPGYHYASEAALFDALSDFWKACSLQMHYLAAANGDAYFHFLQPNQYLPGSKIMGSAEAAKAIREDQPYRKGVVEGYPRLKNAGENLKNAGVHFHDLTMIFAQNQDALYVDDCCHLNLEGYQMIAAAIGKAIRDEYKQP